MPTGKQRRIARALGIVAILSAVAIALVACGGGDDVSQTASRQQPDSANWSTDSFTGGPRLATDKTIVDDGPVAYGHEVRTTFRLRNVGDAPVRIGEIEVRTLEGC